MKIDKIIFALSLGVILCCACFEDNGNYDYLPGNEVTITLPTPAGGSVVVGEEVSILPAIEEKFDTLDYDYRWEVNYEKVAETFELKHSFNVCGRWPVWFFMINKKSGVIFKNNIEVNVNFSYSSGWLILSELDGKSSISYIRPTIGSDNQKAWSVFPDLYKTLHPGDELGTEPFAIQQHYVDFGGGDQILILQRGGGGLMELDGRDFHKVSKTELEFLGAKYPSGIKPKFCAYATGGVDALVGDNGYLFLRSNPKVFQSTQYGTEPVYFDGEILNISYFIEMQYPMCMFQFMFDKSKNRFLGLFQNTEMSSLSGAIMKCVPAPSGYNEGNGFTSLSDFGENKFIYCAPYREGWMGWSADFVTILKTPEGIYRIQEYSLKANGINNNYNLAVSNNREKLFAASDIVSENTKYCLLRMRGKYLFFAEADKLYFYELSKGTYTLFHDFRGKKIVKLVAGIGSENELSVVSEEGEFYLFDITDKSLAVAVNGRLVEPVYMKDGLGKIKDVIWKFGDYLNFLLWM